MDKLIVCIVLLIAIASATNIDPKLRSFYKENPLDKEVSFLALLKEKGNVEQAIQGLSFKVWTPIG